MRLTLLLLMMVSGMLCFGSTAAQGGHSACSAQDRIDLSSAGYTKGEIASICEQPPNSEPSHEMWGILSGEGQARWVQWCVTKQGTCSLNPMLGQYPVGAPCNCYMPWGFYSGMAQ
jgi:hypothetical protein